MGAAEFNLDTSGIKGWGGGNIAGPVRDTLNTWGENWISTLVTERMSGNGRGVIPRTGNLRRDWNSLVVNDGSGATLVVASGGTANAYAGLQEYGGTVRATKAKWLWIPTDENKTPVGVARVTPRQAIAQGGFISFKKGPVFFGKPQTKAQAKGMKGMGPHVIPLFVLKKSVYVPARLGARDLWRRSMPDLAANLTATVKGAIGG